MKNYLVLSFVSDILKGYWTFQAVWKKVCFSVSESSFYGEGAAIFEKATTANQKRGTNRNTRILLKFIIITFFYSFEGDFGWIHSGWIWDDFFCVDWKPIFCPYLLKSLFLVLLQLCWNNKALQHIEYVHLNSPEFRIFVWCSAQCEVLLLWITVFNFSSEYWGFLTSFYQWFWWCESGASETPVNGDFTSWCLLLLQVANSNFQSATIKSYLEKLQQKREAYVYSTAYKEITSDQHEMVFNLTCYQLLLIWYKLIFLRKT